MKLKLVRTTFTNKSTIGELYIDGELNCFTLEDVVRDVKIQGETAIPYGSYRVVIDFSNRFQKMLPHLLDVPGFTGIRIHPGNSAKDTDGCILLGNTKDVDFIGNSKMAFNDFMLKLDKGLKEGSVWIEVTR